MVKNLPVMRETQVRSLGREDPLEKGTATHSSILAWRIPWTEEPGGLQSMGWQRVGHDWVTKHSTCFSVHGILPARILELVDMPSSRGYSQPRDWPHISSISCIVGGFFTAEPLGSLGYGPWGRKELNRTEHAHTFVLWVFFPWPVASPSMC